MLCIILPIEARHRADAKGGGKMTKTAQIARNTPLTRSTIKHVTQQIEAASGCTVTLRRISDDDPTYDYWHAWANRPSEVRPDASRTVASVTGQYPIETLDRLAVRLGIGAKASLIIALANVSLDEAARAAVEDGQEVAPPT